MMKTTENKITITIITAILIFLIMPFMTTGQIQYNHDIELPDGEFVASASRDIIYASGKVYVYTYKNILIYNTAKVYQGKINLGKYGRFAPEYYNDNVYAPDVKFMAFDGSNKLYFVTPSLKVMSVNTTTTTLDTVPNLEIQTPFTGNIAFASLHGYSKLKYDNNNDRLYWLFQVSDANLHSWDSYFGIYKYNNNSFSNIYQEFSNGSDTNTWMESIHTYEFSNPGNFFYVGRKLNIDAMEILPDSVTLVQRIATSAGRIGKMIVVEDNINLVLAFPYKLPYTFPGEGIQKIYQISTSNPTNYDSVTAPNKRVLDAIYLPANKDVISCFANDYYNQSQIVDKDIAIYHYNAQTGFLGFSQTLYTQSPTEIDTSSSLNLNRPFSFLKKSSNKLLLSKKNEIMDISYSSSTGVYSANSIYYAKDSYFGHGTVAAQNTFITNGANSGLEIFDNSLNHDEFIRTAYPVYNVVHNNQDGKLYFFNRLTTENTGFYVYDLETEGQTFIQTDKAIGDLVYNPVQNHILVSEFCEDSDNIGKIKVYGGETNTFVQTLSFAGKNYPGTMFFAPNNKLYLSLNMKADGLKPDIVILDAADYTTTLNSIDITIAEDPLINVNMQSHYCYNPYNNMVYVTFGPYRNYKSPYQNAPNSSRADSSLTAGNGRLHGIDNNDLIILSKQLTDPGEILCSTPNWENGNSNYLGTLFINGEFLNTFDCKTSTLTEYNSISKIVDMEYCPSNNFVYAHNYFLDQSASPDSNRITLYKIAEDGTFDSIWQKSGFGASVSYNKYDEQVYFYYRTDNNHMGQEYAKVYTFDPSSPSNLPTDSVNLQTISFMREVFPQTNDVFFDAYTNRAYFPNGVHSSVSVLNFEPKEPISLTPGPNWLSIPRLEGNIGTNWNEYDPTSIAFNSNNFSTVYDSLYLQHFHAVSEDGDDYDVFWDDDNKWTYYPDPLDNQRTFSYRGYILKLVPDTFNTIYMTGNIKDPATAFPLYKDTKNWIGYFLLEEQDVFDALAEHLDSISEIWHRNYYCYKPNGGGIIFGPNGGGHSNDPWSGPEWACDNSVHTIKYGDMIQVNSQYDMDGQSNNAPLFYWSNGSFTPRNDPRSEPQFYSFTETSSYKPFIIELDTTENPDEIGAFVDGTCVGACIVTEGDTAVILLAYIEGQEDDSVVFQQHSSTKSSIGRTIRSYMVLDEEAGLFEERSISTREGNHRAFVSFKNKTKETNNNYDAMFSIWPNPSKGYLNFSFMAKNKGNYQLLLFDINGRLVSVLESSEHNKGMVRGSSSLKSALGGQLAPGIYFVKLKYDGLISTKKLVIQ